VSRRPYELVVFDWDGTLIDSIGTIVACTRAAFDRLGLPMPEEDAVRGAIGLGLAESVARFSPQADAPFLERLTTAYSECWIGGFHARSRPFAAAVELLEELGDEGYLLAVATAKSRRGLVRDFERTGFGAYFHASRTADEAGSKPSPRMLVELMAELGVETRATLMVGDTVHDLEMAANAGVDAVAVCTGAAARDQLLARTPAACLPSIAELRAWLDRRRVA
jgi:phosphoglycolate phosphatase